MIDNIKPAVNGIGWEVQRLTPQGWRTCSAPYPSWAEAEAALADFDNEDAEYRVYEALRTTRGG